MRVLKAENWSQLNEIVEWVKNNSCSDRIYFRGQSNICWDLSSTLERYCKKQFNVEQYLNITLDLIPQINSQTNQNFNYDIQEVIKILNTKSNGFELKLLCYDYWIYLRHHGFPLPLLDWTQNHEIAAFFALEEEVSLEYSSIYILVNSESQFNSDPGIRIWELGHYIKEVDERHNQQNSVYTLALKSTRSTPENQNLHNCYFYPHNIVFSKNDYNLELFYKVIFPRNERELILKELKEKGIDHLRQLGNTDDIILKSLALEQFRLKDGKFI